MGLSDVLHRVRAALPEGTIVRGELHIDEGRRVRSYYAYINPGNAHQGFNANTAEQLWHEIATHYGLDDAESSEDAQANN